MSDSGKHPFKRLPPTQMQQFHVFQEVVRWWHDEGPHHAGGRSVGISIIRNMGRRFMAWILEMNFIS